MKCEKTQRVERVELMSAIDAKKITVDSLTKNPKGLAKALNVLGTKIARIAAGGVDKTTFWHSNPSLSKAVTAELEARGYNVVVIAKPSKHRNKHIYSVFHHTIKW